MMSLIRGLYVFTSYNVYGILITKKDEKFEITFAYNESVRFGHGMGYNKIYSIEDKLDTGHMLIIKLISDAIVLKE